MGQSVGAAAVAMGWPLLLIAARVPSSCCDRCCCLTIPVLRYGACCCPTGGGYEERSFFRPITKHAQHTGMIVLLLLLLIRGPTPLRRRGRRRHSPRRAGGPPATVSFNRRYRIGCLHVVGRKSWHYYVFFYCSSSILVGDGCLFDEPRNRRRRATRVSSEPLARRAPSWIRRLLMALLLLHYN